MFELILWTCLGASECGREQVLTKPIGQARCERVADIYRGMLGPAATYLLECRPVGNAGEGVVQVE